MTTDDHDLGAAIIDWGLDHLEPLPPSEIAEFWRHADPALVEHVGRTFHPPLEQLTDAVLPLLVRLSLLPGSVHPYAHRSRWRGRPRRPR